jgi:hypothetical protein
MSAAVATPAPKPPIAIAPTQAIAHSFNVCMISLFQL